MANQKELAQQFGELIHAQLEPYLTELTDSELATHADPADSDFLQGLMSQYESASVEEVGDFDELDIEDLSILQLRDKVVQRVARYLTDHIMTAWIVTVGRSAAKRLLRSDFGPAMLPPGCEDSFYRDYEDQVGLEALMEEVDAEVEFDEDAVDEPITTDIAFTKEQLLELMRRVRAALPKGDTLPDCALQYLRMDGIMRPD